MIHLEALRSYFRLGAFLPELAGLRQLVANALAETFTGDLPGSWAEIYGPSLGAELELPTYPPVAIEDDTSCVLLWSADRFQRGIGGMIFYLQAQLMQGDDILIIPIGSADKDDLEHKLKQLMCSMKLDWGLLSGTHHEPSLGPSGYLGAVIPVLRYLVDPDLGALLSAERNAELLNVMCAHLEGYTPYPETDAPHFDEGYPTDIQRNVVHALHQYALLQRR